MVRKGKSSRKPSPVQRGQDHTVITEDDHGADEFVTLETVIKGSRVDDKDPV